LLFIVSATVSSTLERKIEDHKHDHDHDHDYALATTTTTIVRERGCLLYEESRWQLIRQTRSAQREAREQGERVVGGRPVGNALEQREKARELAENAREREERTTDNRQGREKERVGLLHPPPVRTELRPRRREAEGKVFREGLQRGSSQRVFTDVLDVLDVEEALPVVR
jgi:hypothetical protein